MLIFHIDESIMENTDQSHKKVDLEEADGAIDMGFESYLFGSNSNSFGWRWDFWYTGNNGVSIQHCDHHICAVNSLHLVRDDVGCLIKLCY